VSSAPDLIHVIGHRNPDTDAICSAIGYASFTANQQGFFAEHLPSLTEVSTKGKDSLEQQLYRFLELTVTKMLA
jgi:inorganic pyrophosphatase/exopolyphosphatase